MTMLIKGLQNYNRSHRKLKISRIEKTFNNKLQKNPRILLIPHL
jgi:hypothetical protein